MLPLCALALALATDPAPPALPPGALARLGSTQFRRGSTIRGFAFTPDGKRLFTVGSYALIVWDVATGAELHREQLSTSLTLLAMAHDGKSFVTVGAGNSGSVMRLADANTFAERANFRANGLSVTAVALAPDGQRVVAAGHSAKTGERSQSLIVWDAAGKEQKRYPLELETFRGSLSFSPDGSTVVLGASKQPLWHVDVVTGKMNSPFPGNARRATAGAYTPDGKLFVATNEEGSVTVWECKTAKELRRFGGSQAGANAVKIDATGRTVAVAVDGSVRLFDIASGRPVKTFTAPSHTYLFSFALSPDGKTVALAREAGTFVQLWDATTGKERPQSGGAAGQVMAVAFAPDGKTFVTASTHGSLSLIDANTYKLRITLGTYSGVEYGGMAFSPDGKRLAAGDENLMRYDTRAAKVERTFTGVRGSIRGSSVAFSPDGRFLYATDKKQIQRYDLLTGKAHADFDKTEEQFNRLTTLALSPDGKLLAASGLDAHAIRLIDATTGKLLRSLPTKDGTNTMVFAGDGRVLATANASNVSLWTVADNSLYGKWKEGDQVRAIAVRPDGRVLALGTAEGTVKLVAVGTGQTLKTLTGHGSIVATLAFAPDGANFVSGGNDGYTFVWAVDDVPEITEPGPTFKRGK